MAEIAGTFDSDNLDANSILVADSSNLFQTEVDSLRQSQADTSFVELKPEPGEGIWALAREAYRLTGQSEPTATQVKALAQDIARRNSLPLDAELNSDQRLMVKMPGRIDGSVGPRQDKDESRVNADFASGSGPGEGENGSYVRKVSMRPAPGVTTADLTPGKAPEKKIVKQKRSIDGPRCSDSLDEVNMIANWVTKNEAGHKAYTAFNPDDSGAGISVGLMQWNQEKGLLPDLVEEWHDRNPARFNQVFGTNANNMLDESWLRSVDFSNAPGLTQDMKEALSVPEFQRVQLDLRNEHIEESCELAKGYGFTSLRGRAVIADLVNQLGKGGTRRFLNRVPLTGNESHRIEQLKTVTDDRVNAADRIAIIEQEVRKIWRQQAVVQN